MPGGGQVGSSPAPVALWLPEATVVTPRGPAQVSHRPSHTRGSAGTGWAQSFLGCPVLCPSPSSCPQPPLPWGSWTPTTFPISLEASSLTLKGGQPTPGPTSRPPCKRPRRGSSRIESSRHPRRRARGEDPSTEGCPPTPGAPAFQSLGEAGGAGAPSSSRPGSPSPRLFTANAITSLGDHPN